MVYSRPAAVKTAFSSSALSSAVPMVIFSRVRPRSLRVSTCFGVLDLLVNIFRLIRNRFFVDGFFLDFFTAQFLRFLDGFGRVLCLSFQYFFHFFVKLPGELFSDSAESTAIRVL